MVRIHGRIFPVLGVGLTVVCCIFIPCVIADNDGPASQRRPSCRQSLRRCQRNSYGALAGEVCGSDGRTYPSHCSLLFAACRRQIFTQGRGRAPWPSLVHTGACQDDAYYGIRNSTGLSEGTLASGGSNNGRVPFGEQQEEEEEDEEEGEQEEGGEYEDKSNEDSSEEDESNEEDGDSDGYPFNPTTRPPTVSSSMTSLPLATSVSTGTAPVSNRPMPTGMDRTPGFTGPTPTAPPTVAPTCAPSCPLDNSHPVCATDGETYNSRCLLESHACQTGDPSLMVLYDGPCIAADVVPLPRRDPTTLASHRRLPQPTTVPDRPVRERLSYCPTEAECSMLYLPVCGSDDTTYSSWCHLRLVACASPTDDLTVSHMGECPEDTDSGCGEPCPDVFEPVCGGDNMTYHSLCSLQRIACIRGEDLPTVLHDGECSLPPLVCPEACPGINDPVCGTDGNSYSSLCVIRLVACRSEDEREKQLRLAYRGLCMNEPCQKGCPEREYAPLCGSNGRTYQNECFLWLEMCRNPDLVRFDKDCNMAIP